MNASRYGHRVITPGYRLDKLGETETMTLPRILEMTLDYRGAVVVNILQRLIGEVDKRYVIKIPLGLVESRNVE